MANSIKFKNNNYIDSTGVTHNRELLSNIINTQNNNISQNSSDISMLKSKIKIVELYGSIKSPTIVTLSDYVQNYDFILVGMTSNYWDHYQYINILGHAFNGLYDWRNQRLAYFDGDGKLAYDGYCHIYDNKFDGTGITLSNDLHITWIKGLKLL